MNIFHSCYFYVLAVLERALQQENQRDFSPQRRKNIYRDCNFITNGEPQRTQDFSVFGQGLPIS
jgi:hypothetical protein